MCGFTQCTWDTVPESVTVFLMSNCPATEWWAPASGEIVTATAHVPSAAATVLIVERVIASPPKKRVSASCHRTWGLVRSPCVCATACRAENGGHTGVWGRSSAGTSRHADQSGHTPVRRTRGREQLHVRPYARGATAPGSELSGRLPVFPVSRLRLQLRRPGDFRGAGAEHSGRPEADRLGAQLHPGGLRRPLCCHGDSVRTVGGTFQSPEDSGDGDRRLVRDYRALRSGAEPHAPRRGPCRRRHRRGRLPADRKLA